MITLLVSGVDDTLLNCESQSVQGISPPSKILPNKGFRFALPLGKYQELQEINRQLDMKSHCVSQNGSFVHLNLAKRGNYIDRTKYYLF